MQEEPTGPTDHAGGGGGVLTTFATTGVVAAPIDRVWDLVADFAGIMRWHPSLTRCVTDGVGVGARRTLQLGDREVVERLDELDHESHVVQYSIVEGRPQTIGLTGRIQLESTADGQTSVRWQTIVPDHPGAEDLVDGLRSYYRGRVGNLCDAALAPAS